MVLIYPNPMERFSSLLDSVKERLSNPFFFSFILSWLIFNWQVPIALATFNDSQLAATGCANYVEYIIYKTSNQESWLYPLYAAVGYTLVIPLLMIVLRIFNALVIKLSNSGVFWVSKDTPVSFEKYIAIKDRYKKSTDAYAKLVTEEKKTFDTLEQTKSSLNEALSRKNEAEIENQEKQKKLTDDYTNIIEKHKANLSFKETQIENLNTAIVEFGKDTSRLKEVLERKSLENLGLEAEKNKISFEFSNQQISMRDDFEKIKQNLERNNRDEKRKLITELNNVETALTVAFEKNQDLEQKVDAFKKALDVTLIDGEWEMRIREDDQDLGSIKSAEIRNGTLSINSDHFRIVNFFSHGNHISFFLDMRNDKDYEYYTLEMDTRQVTMRGLVNSNHQVSFFKRLT